MSYADQYPESHLLSGEVTVPPGLFQKRWIVLNSKKPLDVMRLTAKQNQKTDLEILMWIGQAQGYL